MITDLIRQRKSVRTFNGKPLCIDDRSALENYTASLTNPFSVPITFRLLDVKEYGLSSPVIVGADTYLAAKVEKAPNFEIAYGYSFEKLCLYALSRGIGTVMLAASLSRAAFEKAMEVKDSEVMPVASATSIIPSLRRIPMRRRWRWRAGLRPQRMANPGGPWWTATAFISMKPRP